MMESLENKLDRLSAEQRREVEDFVDFLIQRAEGIRVTVQLAPHDAPAINPAVPPLIVTDPASPEEHVPEGSAPPIGNDGDRKDEPRPQGQESSKPEGSADGYFDYGRFEKAPIPEPSAPSPADVAVQKVKRKLIQKNEQDSKNQLLDWID